MLAFGLSTYPNAIQHSILTKWLRGVDVAGEVVGDVITELQQHAYDALTAFYALI